MCKAIEDNRRLVSNLIYTRRTFTAEEIIQAYKAIRGNAIVDGFESIRGFIRGLEEMGALRQEGGKYVVNI